MAKQTIGKASIDAEVNPQGLEVGLRKATADIKRFSKDTKKDLQDASGGFLENLSRRAKEVKKQGSASGENALNNFIGGGARGMLNFGLESIGAGMVGVLVDVIGKATLELAKTAADSYSAYMAGKKGAGEITTDLFKKAPLLGSSFEAAWTIGDLYADIGNQMGKKLPQNMQWMAPMLEFWRAPGTEEKRGREFGLTNKGFDANLRNIGYDMKAEATNNPFEKQKLAIQKEIDQLRDGFVTALGDINAKPFSDTQKQELRGKAQSIFTGQIGVLAARHNDLSVKAGGFLHDARRGGEIGGMGMASQQLGMLQSMPGGDSDAAQRLQRMLSVRSQSLQMGMALDKVIRDTSLPQEQRDQAQKQKSMLAKNQEFFLKQAEIGGGDGPRRFAGAEYANSQYSGAAQYAFEADLAKQSSDPALKDAAERTASAVEQLVQLYIKGAQLTGAPVLPNADSAWWGGN